MHNKCLAKDLFLEREKEREKITLYALAFLNQCKENELSVYQVLQVLTEAKQHLEFSTYLSNGFKHP